MSRVWEAYTNGERGAWLTEPCSECGGSEQQSLRIGTGSMVYLFADRNDAMCDRCRDDFDRDMRNEAELARLRGADGGPEGPE